MSDKPRIYAYCEAGCKWRVPHYDEIAANSIKATSVTLAADSWSSKRQTVAVEKVTAVNSVIVSPAPDSHVLYRDCGVYCSSQANGTLTFTCDTVPAVDLTVNVLVVGA